MEHTLNSFANSTGDASSSNDPILPSIFVQIPMAYDPLPNCSGSSAIKAEESIKSEVTEMGHRKPQSPFLLGNEEMVTARVKPLKVHKCKQCAFLTISPAKLTSHTETHREASLEEVSLLTCPGCPNTFRAKKSLEIHLLYDHQILEAELEAIVEFATLPGQTKSPPNSNRSTPKARPSRIFIKSVDVLRNPMEEGFLQNHNRLFLKNVNVLRNPELEQGVLSSEILQSVEQLCDSVSEFPSIEQNNPGIVVTEAQSFGLSGMFNNDCTPSPIDLDRGDLIVITPTSISESAHSSTADHSDNTAQDEPGRIYLRNAETMKTPGCTEISQNNAFLHLRTVDELNLMNLEDVQSINRHNTMSNDNSKHSCDEVVVLDDAQISSNLFSIPTGEGSGENRDNTLSATVQDMMANYVVMNDKESSRNDDGNSFKTFLTPNGDGGHLVENQNTDFGTFQGLENIIEAANYYTPTKIIPFDDTNNTFNQQPCFCVPEETFQGVLSAEQDRDHPRDTNIPYQGQVIPIDDNNDEINTPTHSVQIPSPIEIENEASEEAKTQEDTKALGRIYVCHTNEKYGIICPECKSVDFRNWNTLHTHLWREHQIDMELYSCELCNFKTPVLSRLKNTHVKIHSEERNFKCELQVRKCDYCPATLVTGRQYKKHLRAEHECSSGHTCGVCGKVMNSVSALKIHERKHTESGHFACPECSYTTHDHNAARRHRMKHSKEKQYKCPFCGYKSIQSTTYRNHLAKVHPAQAAELIFKCPKCSFETINSTNQIEQDIFEIFSDATEPPPETPPPLPTVSSPKHNKIKVKSNLVLRDPSKFINTNNLLLQNLQPHQMLPTSPADQHLPLIRPALFSKTFDGDGVKQLKLTDRLPPNLNNLSYHRQCHTNEKYGIICPECKSVDFRNWNTLHTHLWREHQIDMELYSCELCNFKTPVLSRLKNTHVKIHSEERNFKCEVCEKRFKNTKQLKNHRRIHRNVVPDQLQVRKCDYCPATLVTGRQYKKHLRAEHECSSYTTHDHNAARRHRMKHSKEKQYKCPFCGYKSIQSTTYRNHLAKVHPAQAAELIFKCPKCSFETINSTKYRLHVAKHEGSPAEKTADKSLTPPPLPTVSSPKHNKIKVKSNLVLRDPSKFINTNNLLLQNLQPHQMLPTSPADQHLPLIRPALFSKTFDGDGVKQLKLTDRLPPCSSPQYPNIDLT
uniref:Putative ovo n=1 Tax=Lutzomyia longipalpis TaxID=7200 RepID=A0A1B0CJJ8_LUTLO